jgi:hypothetical protein
MYSSIQFSELIIFYEEITIIDNLKRNKKFITFNDIKVNDCEKHIKYKHKLQNLKI